MKQSLGAFSGLRQKDGMVLELGMLDVRLQEKVAGIAKPMEYFPKPIPVDRSLIWQRMGVRSLVIVDVYGKEPMAELLQHVETRALHVLVT